MPSRFLLTIFAALSLMMPALALPAQQPTVMNKPTLFLIGDAASTPQAVQSTFDQARITLVFTPTQGLTTRTFVNSGQWDALLQQIKPGDFVLIDFNPEDTTPEDQSAARRVLTGAGDGTFDYLDPGTHKLELVHSFGWYLRKLVVDVINQGANPILAAPTSSATEPAPDQTPIAQNGKDSMSPDALALAPGTSTPPPQHPGAAKHGAGKPQPQIYPDWAKVIATEQRIPFANLGQSTLSLTAPTLRQALQSMNPDPLAPYLSR